jgi:alpha-glucosidase
MDAKWNRAIGWFLMLVFLWCGGGRARAVQRIVVGKVGIEVLSDSLVRLELKGPEGFEDRPTFHVVNRDWPGVPGIAVSTNAGMVTITCDWFYILVPVDAKSLNGIEVGKGTGNGSEGFNTAYHCDGMLSNSVWLPEPAEKPMAWAFADTPRMVLPKWGLTPAPRNASDAQTSGWDLSNDAPDIYVFLPGGDYQQLRADFLKLTGPTEMPPLFAFGAFDSRWHDYAEAEALKEIDDVRGHGLPLDVLVIDTGWRKGASTGYEPNTNLFPNMARFLKEAHAKNVRVLFNDHPEPVSADALDPKELDYRYQGLAGLLNEGLDVWWYDRNWMVALKTPMPGLRKEVWGMRMYHDMTLCARPDVRPLIMANVDGIDNGIVHHPMDAAAHRFPIQWTGDIGPGYDFLRRSVEASVSAGVTSLFPYMSEDLGGHTADPTPEGYIRWIEFGALSPVYRPHCTYNHQRMPWTFGAAALRVAQRFENMRYRLLPVFYTAAHENYVTGEPLMRRLDLDFPQYPEAARNDEYLLGDNILVAPVMEAMPTNSPDQTTAREVWLPPGEWIDAWNGQVTSGPVTVTNSTPLAQEPIFIRRGAVIPLAPEMQYSWQTNWGTLALDIYPKDGVTNRATVYEDDTTTTAYQRGEFRTTTIAMTTAEGSLGDFRPVKGIVLNISTKGKFKGELTKRAWVLRVHQSKDWTAGPTVVMVNGRRAEWPEELLKRDGSATPFGFRPVVPSTHDMSAPDADVYEFSIPESNISRPLRIEIGY